MSVEKNKETKAGRDFWGFVESTSATVASWPDWKKLGWDVGVPSPNQQDSIKKNENRSLSKSPADQLERPNS